MTLTSSSRARHRAARRPATVMSSFGATATVTRRGTLAAASSGLVITMAASTAAAAPSDSTLASVDVSTLTAEARTALTTNPKVAVPADAVYTALEGSVVAEASPAPEPQPEVEPAVDRTEQAAARTRTERAEVQAEAAPAVESQAAPANPSGSAIVDIAYRYIGAPYVFGGASPAGFDCSGFTSYVYAQVGISLPRSSSEQRYAGTQVSAGAAQPGDLVWWPGHVGIYVGGGQYIAAFSPGTPLSVRPIYKANPTFIRVA